MALRTRLILLHAALTAAAAVLIIGLAVYLGNPPALAVDPPEVLDPAAWGDDHVGKRIPDYVTGEECLFCHRHDIGTKWQPNRHNNAMQIMDDGADPALQALRDVPLLAPLADEVLYLVGHTRMKRYLKPDQRYGQVAMLNTAWIPPRDDEPAHFRHAEDPRWDNDVFAEKCAGCHATAVDTEIRGFATFSNDCFTCHGNVPAAHNADTSLVFFGAGNTFGSQVEMSICGSCHLRGGHSRSTGLPYPNQFVPGDNLFRDFQVDFSDEYIESLNPADRHVYENARDVVLHGNTEMTCMTCHDIHDMSTRKHRVLRRLQRDAYCAICHDDPDDYKSLIHYDVHSETCQY